MKNLLLFIVVIGILVLSSCDLFETDKDRGTDPIAGCFLQKTSWSIPNDPAHETTDYSYDTSGKLIEVLKKSWDLEPDPYIERTTISYNGDKLNQIKIYITYTDPEEMYAEYSFFYTGDLPDSITYPKPDPINDKGYMLAEYSGNKLSKLVFYNHSTFTYTYSEVANYNFEWTGDNIIKITLANINSTNASVTEYKYDDKKTPLSNLGLALTSNLFTMLSSNNVIKSTRLNPDGSISNTSETTYTYNDSDYPLTVTWSVGYPTNYEYDCN
ncbi:MAG: hypothetical protein HQ541_19875 [Mariniphaga sp.]|nr:hypothetical protein [Mariniphaga sp.]